MTMMVMMMVTMIMIMASYDDLLPPCIMMMVTMIMMIPRLRDRERERERKRVLLRFRRSAPATYGRLAVLRLPSYGLLPAMSVMPVAACSQPSVRLRTLEVVLARGHFVQVMGTRHGGWENSRAFW